MNHNNAILHTQSLYLAQTVADLDKNYWGSQNNTYKIYIFNYCH